MEEVADKAVSLALQRVGLDDETAGKDVRDLRTLIDSWRTVKKTAFETAFKWAIVGILGSISLALYVTYGWRK